MARIVLLLVLVLPSSAWADRLVGTAVTLAPPRARNGGMNGWFAVGWDSTYVGGELAVGGYTRGRGDFGTSLHALIGQRIALSPRFSLLADAGLGITAQTDYHLAIFGGESTSENVGTPWSGALRVHLVAVLNPDGRTRFAVGLTSDARTTLDGDSRGFGIGLGLFAMR